MATKVEIHEHAEFLLKRLRELRGDGRCTEQDRDTLDVAASALEAVFTAHCPLPKRSAVPKGHCAKACAAWSKPMADNGHDGCRFHLFEPWRKAFCGWTDEELRKGAAPGKHYYKRG